MSTKRPLWYRALDGLWKFFHRTAKRLLAHTKKVNRTRYCACCGGFAIYFASTAFRDMTPEELTFPSDKPDTIEGEQVESLLTTGTPEFYFCGDHHPLIGKKRAEAHDKLKPFHRKLEFHFITPNPFM